MSTGKNIVNWISRNQPTVYNGLFVLYLFFLQEPILVASSSVATDDLFAPSFGVLLLVIILLETVALPEKFTALRHYKASVVHKERSFSTLGIVWIGHMVVVIFLAMFMMSAFGVDLEEDSVAMIVFPILVMKELVMGGFLAGITDSPKKKFSKGREVLANIFLFMFVCVAYTAIWQNIASLPEDFGGSLQVIVTLPLMALLFYMFYIPMRFGFFAEELLIADTKKERTWLYISYIGAGIVGIWPFIQAIF